MVWYHTLTLHAVDPAVWDGSTMTDLPEHMDCRDVPKALRPERWLGADAKGKPRNYYTFGSGLHLCAGMNLFYLELKVCYCFY